MEKVERHPIPCYLDKDGNPQDDGLWGTDEEIEAIVPIVPINTIKDNMKKKRGKK